MSKALLAGGLVLVLILAGVYGALVYRDRARPAEPDSPVAKDQPGKSDPASNGKSTAPAVEPPRLLFKDWPQPAAVLLLSGEQHGHFEPCGCSLIQLGGFARRDDLLRQIRDRKWPVGALDAGGLIKRKFAQRRQSKIKFETMLSALKDMKYGGLAVGVEELKLGPEYLLSQHNPQELPFLSANVVLFGSPEVGTPVPKSVMTVGDLKVGVTADFGPSLKPEVLPAGAAGNAPSDIAIEDPKTALTKVISELEAGKPDLLVLISHASVEESKGLAEAFPQVQLILSTGGPEDPDPRPQFVGKTMLVTVGAKGKHVGVVGIYPDDQEHPLRFELVDLDNQRFQNSPRMEDHMRFYQERLKAENIAATDPAITHPTGADFVGAAKCGECHKKAFNKWKGTKHAHAFDSLKVGRKGQEKTWISRVYDPECLSCHVTGWSPQDVLRYQSGYVDEQQSAHLLGQQCENCHGPGSQHVEAEEKYAKSRKMSDDLVRLRKSQHLDLVVAEKHVCRKCHDEDNSPAFQFEKYWKEVVHPFRD